MFWEEMNVVRTVVYVFLCFLVAGLWLPACAQAVEETSGWVDAATSGEASSSSVAGDAELPDAPSTAVFRRKNDRSRMNLQYQTNIRRFSHYAVALKLGAEGIGVDVATPLSNKWNLRAGVNFLGGTYNFTTSTSGASNFGASVQEDQIGVTFQPHFRSVSLSADWFPRYGSFRVSPGLTLYNGNKPTVVATVLGGQKIDVGDGTYTSDPNDPIVATVVTKLGRTVAPRLTMGWGNMIPRAGEHFSFPFEVGVEYVGRPQLQLSLAGSECDPGGGCYAVASDPATAANVLEEQKELNNDIAPLRFYPILSMGVSYRF